jgi:hypothetical protein
MQYGRLGQTALKVSRIEVGCMSFGNPAFPSGPSMRRRHSRSSSRRSQTRTGRTRASAHKGEPSQHLGYDTHNRLVGMGAGQGCACKRRGEAGRCRLRDMRVRDLPAGVRATTP